MIMWMLMIMFLVVIMKMAMIMRMKMITSVACGGAFGCRVDAIDLKLDTDPTGSAAFLTNHCRPFSDDLERQIWRNRCSAIAPDLFSW